MGTGYISIAIFILFCCFHFGNAADPVLSWTAWTDSVGNTANENSDVVWAPIPLPDNTSYKLGAIEYDSRGLEPLYNFAKAFINGAVFPYGVSWGKYYSIFFMYHFNIHLKKILTNAIKLENQKMLFNAMDSHT